MGAAAAKCSELASGKPDQVTTKAKVTTQVMDEEEEDEEEADDEEDESDEAEEAAKHEAEAALQVLKRGRTTAFKEAIEHATSLGVDEEKILKAEAMLEQHKVMRRKEIFAAELETFLASDDGNDMEKCEERQKTGESCGVSQQVLAALLERMEVIGLSRDLEDDEIERAKTLMQLSARKFVQSCLRGRATTWLDLKAGKQKKALCRLDSSLRTMRVVQEAGEAELCSLALMSAKAYGATGQDEVSGSKGFTKLSDQEQDNAVVIFDSSGGGPWVIVESSPVLAAEVLAALAVLGAGNGDSTLSSSAHSKLQQTVSRLAANGGGDAQIWKEDENPKEAPAAEVKGKDKDKKDKKEKEEKPKEEKHKKADDKKDKKAKK